MPPPTEGADKASTPPMQLAKSSSCHFLWHKSVGSRGSPAEGSSHHCTWRDVHSAILDNGKWIDNRVSEQPSSYLVHIFHAYFIGPRYFEAIKAPLALLLIVIEAKVSHFHLPFFCVWSMSKSSSDPEDKLKKMEFAAPPKQLEPHKCWFRDICKIVIGAFEVMFTREKIVTLYSIDCCTWAENILRT
jgi:hypothetical protein